MNLPEENEIIETQDGSHSILSKRFGVSYHSKYGALQESQHVFIHAGLNPCLLRKKEEVNILEFGFGTGLNAYLSFLTAEKQKRKINYVGIEAYPIDQDMVNALNYAALLERSEVPFQTMHTSPWGETIEIGEFCTFKKIKGLFEDQAFDAQFDVIYFDAFAPTSQPSLWEEALLKIAYDALMKDGIFVTYCAKGAVKRALKAIGFEVEALPGPPGKREMTRGIKRS